MPYTAEVRVTFKDPNNSEKKYVAKKPCSFYESVDECKRDRGESGALAMINAQVKEEFATNLRAKLKAKVLGEDTGSADVEDMSALLDD